MLRADQQIQAIGLQTGAKPGARLCHLTSQPVSASTVLRIIRKIPIDAEPVYSEILTKALATTFLSLAGAK